MVQQFSLKVVLKKFGEKGREVVTNELKQLHDMIAYMPIDPLKMINQ